MIESTFKKPNEKKWYVKWWGVSLIVFVGLFFSLAVASAIFMFTMSAKLKSGAISPEELFGKKYAVSHNETLYGVNSPTLGSAGAPVSMVVFLDFSSIQSGDSMVAVNKIMYDEYYKNQVNFIFRHFPNIADPLSIAASLAIECAYEQERFFEMANAIFSEPDISQASFSRLASASGLDKVEFESCFQSQQNLFRIDRDGKDGQYLGVKASPTFIINDKIVEGTPRVEDIKKAIDLMLIEK